MTQRSPQAATEVLQATIETVLFRSEDARFGVVRASREPGGEDVVLVGDLAHLCPGETLRLRGRWQRHASFGTRFRVESFAPVTPRTAQGIARYLGSGLVPGVGPSLAERLVARFGERTLDVIASQSGRLREVDGIGPQRAKAIAEAVRTRRDEAELLSHLQGLGIGPRLAQRILRRYAGRTQAVLREDPYRLAQELPGIGFRTADRIGRAGGIEADDPRRAEGALLHVLAAAADEGHVFLPAQTLAEKALALDVPPPRVDEALGALCDRGRVVDRDGRVYLPPLHRAEEAVAQCVRRLAQAAPRLDARRATQLLEEDRGLSESQRRAVAASLQHGLLVLTGGPGTGKTTTVRSLVRVHEAAKRRVVLAAPTGRAAKRLSEATEREAKTIHRLLEFNPVTHGFARGASLPLEADVVLVDEASMLDLRLAQALLAALPEHAQLILVGDVDQLPPVGAGQVLRDVIDSGVAPVARLSEVFRQAQKSAIVRGAHRILSGQAPEATSSGTRGEGDLFIVRAGTPEALTTRLLESLDRIPEAYGIDARDGVQVLVPMRRGPLGTEQLNGVLQAHFQRKRPPPDATAGPHRGLHVGDKVMQLRNDYERDVFNGDVGTVRRVESGVVFVDMGGREVAYDGDALDALSLAYATTIHKVQGSEFPAVIVVLHGTHHVLLSRALVYTAVTRARRLVVILGEERALHRAVRNQAVKHTHSWLAQRLQQAR